MPCTQTTQRNRPLTARHDDSGLPQTAEQRQWGDPDRKSAVISQRYYRRSSQRAQRFVADQQRSPDAVRPQGGVQDSDSSGTEEDATMTGDANATAPGAATAADADSANATEAAATHENTTETAATTVGNGSEQPAAMPTHDTTTKRSAPCCHDTLSRHCANMIYACDRCNAHIWKGQHAYGCRICDYDLCGECHHIVQEERKPPEVHASAMKAVMVLNLAAHLSKGHLCHLHCSLSDSLLLQLSHQLKQASHMWQCKPHSRYMCPSLQCNLKVGEVGPAALKSQAHGNVNFVLRSRSTYKKETLGLLLME